MNKRSEYNRNISTPQSKNPTAAQLVADTAAYSPLLLASGDSSSAGSPIKGGVHAPYYWKDFIYCKYYGTIPNNRLITLRRFPYPCTDNIWDKERKSTIPYLKIAMEANANNKKIKTSQTPPKGCSIKRNK